MVTVPTLSTPQIEQRGISPGYQNPPGVTEEAFGSSRGRALDQTGRRIGHASDELFQLALKAQIEDNERALKQAHVTYKTKLLDIGFGDGTPDNPGYYNTKGDNAVNGVAGVKEAMQRARKDVAGGITNKRVQQMFEDVSAEDNLRELKTVDRHVSAQREIANDTASQARIDVAKNEAMLAWNDPERLKRAQATISSEVADFARRRGLSPEVVKQQLAAENGSLLAGVISAASIHNPAAARALLNTHKGEMTGAAAVHAEQNIKHAENTARVAAEHAANMQDRKERKDAFRAFDGYVTQMMTNPEAGIDLQSAARDPRLSGPNGVELKVRLNSMVTRMTKGETLNKISEANVPEILSRMQLPVGDPKRIDTVAQLSQEFIDGRLNTTHLDWLTKKLTESRTPEGSLLSKTQHDFMTNFKSQFTGNNLGFADPEGGPAFYKFTRYVDAQVQEAKKKGEDPHQLFNPNSPKYIGDRGIINQFLLPLNDRIKLQMNNLSAPTGEQRGLAPAAPPAALPGTPGGERLNLGKGSKATGALDANKYASPAELKRALDAGEIDYEQAKLIAKTRKWIDR